MDLLSPSPFECYAAADGCLVLLSGRAKGWASVQLLTPTIWDALERSLKCAVVGQAPDEIKLDIFLDEIRSVIYTAIMP
jgi:hypothetical protein